MNEPVGHRHVWQQIPFKSGAPLWKCIYCDETSYDDLPQAKGCPSPKALHKTGAQT